MNLSTSEAQQIVRDSAMQREAQAERPMTIPEAIDHAERLRTTPETVIDGPSAKRLIDAMLSAIQASRCYYKSMKAGDEVFVLRQRDRAAVPAIHEWSRQAEEHGCSPDKVQDAVRTAARWAAQPDRLTKWPD